MRFTVTQETMIFLQSVVLGFAVGMIYDITKSIREELKLHKIFIFMLDLLFCIFFMFVTVCFVITFAEAVFRLYVVVGEVLGIVLYMFSFSIVLLKLEKMLMKVVYLIIISPIRFIMEKISKILNKIIKKVYDIAFLGLKNKVVLVYNRKRENETDKREDT